MKRLVALMLQAFLVLAACSQSTSERHDADASDGNDVDAGESNPEHDDFTDDLSPGDGTTGSPCSDQEDCGGVPALSPLCIQQLNCQSPVPDGAYADVYTTVLFPGGYCSAACTSSAECGPEAQCTEYCNQRICMESCQTDTDCRMPYLCLSSGDGEGACRPPSG